MCDWMSKPWCICFIRTLPCQNLKMEVGTHTHRCWLLSGNIYSQQEVLCIYSGTAGRAPLFARGVKAELTHPSCRPSNHLSADGCDVLFAETKAQGSRSSAGWVAVGGLGTAPALLTVQTLAAHDPGPRRGHLRIDRMGVCRLEGRLARYILVWDRISLFGASPALSNESKSPESQAGPRARALAWVSTGSNRARLSHPSHFVRVGPTSGPPARTGTGQSQGQATARRIRVAGLGGESCGAGGRLPVCRTHRNRRDAKLSGQGRSSDPAFRRLNVIGCTHGLVVEPPPRAQIIITSVYQRNLFRMLAGALLRNLGWKPHREGGTQRAQHLASHMLVVLRKSARPMTVQGVDSGPPAHVHSSILLGWGLSGFYKFSRFFSGGGAPCGPKTPLLPCSRASAAYIYTRARAHTHTLAGARAHTGKSLLAWANVMSALAGERVRGGRDPQPPARRPAA